MFYMYIIVSDNNNKVVSYFERLTRFQSIDSEFCVNPIYQKHKPTADFKSFLIQIVVKFQFWACTSISLLSQYEYCMIIFLLSNIGQRTSKRRAVDDKLR